MRRSSSLPAFAVLFLLASACIVEAPSSPDSAAREAATVEKAPATLVKNGAVFDDRLELVGAEFKPGRLTPGGAVEVTVYYLVRSELSSDQEVFVHVEDPSGQMNRFVLDHAIANGVYPAQRWRVGETLRDSYTIRLPGDASPRAVDVWTGMWNPKTGERMKVGNAEGVRHDGNGRVLLVQLPVSR
ncbi:MAG TPA: hypothetical protein VK013_00700 [Myxococcaceae bacterium]|nr:hypothetical protein [Myxococcaceae bacterium]